MTNPIVLEPVSEQDPCGPDLRWDTEFLELDNALAAAAAQGGASVVEGEVVEASERAYNEVVAKAVALSSRTKDLRVLAIYAEASWHHAGLVAFAEAMEELAGVAERWPGGQDGLHPRADEVDGDFGERAAAVGKLLNRIPTLVATVGWGTRAGDSERVHCAVTLRGVFDAWAQRLGDALGPDLPSVGDAWRSLQRLVGGVGASDADAVETAEESVPRSVDAWDLIDQALERMVEQDHHSPALPLLRLLSSWRSLGIIDIVDQMKTSGVTLEQLMESVKRQTQSE